MCDLGLVDSYDFTVCCSIVVLCLVLGLVGLFIWLSCCFDFGFGAISLVAGPGMWVVWLFVDFATVGGFVVLVWRAGAWGVGWRYW